MLGCVDVPGAGRSHLVNCGYTGGPVGCNLFANAEMQAHVQERIRLPAIRRIVSVQIIAAYIGVVLRVHLDDVSNLHLER